jgi:hypothetical protein
MSSCGLISFKLSVTDVDVMDLAYDPARSNVASSGALLVDTHLQRMVNSMHRKLSLTAALRRGSYEGKKRGSFMSAPPGDTAYDRVFLRHFTRRQE